MSNSFAALAGMGLLAMLVMVVVGILIAGLVLCVAFRLVVGHMPSYLRALGAVLLTAVAVVVVSGVLQMILPGGLSGLLAVATEFLVGAAVVDYLLPEQTGLRIGYGKACLVQLVYLVTGLVLGLIVSAIMAVLFGSMLVGLH
jgi:hypothetical protein